MTTTFITSPLTLRYSDRMTFNDDRVARDCRRTTSGKFALFKVGGSGSWHGAADAEHDDR